MYLPLTAGECDASHAADFPRPQGVQHLGRQQTFEDYALRFTAKKARRWSIDQVAKTALGATAFLALEALAAAVTLSYGFTNTIVAMFTVAAVIFITGLPILITPPNMASILTCSRAGQASVTSAPRSLR